MRAPTRERNRVKRSSDSTRVCRCREHVPPEDVGLWRVEGWDHHDGRGVSTPCALTPQAHTFTQLISMCFYSFMHA